VEAVLPLLDDAAGRQALASLARQRVREHYTAARNASAYLDLYGRLCAGGSGARTADRSGTAVSSGKSSGARWMCGIAGFLESWGGCGGAQWREAREARGGGVQDRGSDSGGVWVALDAGLGLAHRRLAIVALTAAGAQAMLSGSGPYRLAVNAEIENFCAL